MYRIIVPPGHALVYVGVLYFTKTAFTKLHRRLLEKIFTIIVIVYATVFLIFENDIFGFLMTGFTLFILRKRPRERLFYLSMYLTVAYLEIIGTNFFLLGMAQVPPLMFSLFYQVLIHQVELASFTLV